MIELLLIWSVFSIATAVVAATQGRNAFAWFAIGLLLGPFGFIVFSLVASKDFSPLPGEVGQCSLCAQPIRLEAAACQQCGHERREP